MKPWFAFDDEEATDDDALRLVVDAFAVRPLIVSVAASCVVTLGMLMMALVMTIIARTMSFVMM